MDFDSALQQMQMDRAKLKSSVERLLRKINSTTSPVVVAKLFIKAAKLMTRVKQLEMSILAFNGDLSEF